MVHTIALMDADALVRVGIRSLLNWQTYGMELVGVCCDRAELDVLLSRPVDVLLWGVQPGGDDPASIRQLIQLHPELGVIVLSSSLDDELMLQCAQAGAFDMLSRRSLDGPTLLSAIQRVRYVRWFHSQRTMYPLHIALSRRRAERLREVLRGDSSAETLGLQEHALSWAISIHIEMHAEIPFEKPDLYQLFSNTHTVAEMLYTCRSIMNCAADHGCLWTAELERTRYEQMLLVYQGEDLGGLLHALADYILPSGVALHIGVSLQGVPSCTLAEMIAQARLASEYCFVYAGSMVHHYQPTRRLIDQDAMDGMLDLNALKQAIMELDSGRIAEQMVIMRDRLQQVYFRVKHFNLTVIGAILELTRSFRNDLQVDRLEGGRQEPIHQVIHALNLDQLTPHLVSYFLMLPTAGRAIRESERIYAAAKLYVDRHYSEELSLSLVAGSLYVSSTYLCKLFRKYGNSSITEYIARRRMGEAKRLLEQPGKKLSTIAQEIGLHSSEYFARLFKRYEQVTPGEYRKRRMSRTEQ